MNIPNSTILNVPAPTQALVAVAQDKGQAFIKGFLEISEHFGPSKLINLLLYPINIAKNPHQLHQEHSAAMSQPFLESSPGRRLSE